MTVTNRNRMIPTRRRLLMGMGGLAALAAALGLLNGLPALAAAPAKALTAEDRADLGRVEEYLNGIRSMQARFQQFSPNAGLAFGNIYMRRPGRLRVEYEPPVPVLLVSDGSLVSVYDSELDELNQLPLGSSPLWFLLRDPIRFDEAVTVTSVDRRPGALRVIMYQSSEPDAGTVTLIFADSPLELKNWTIVDSAGNEVTVGLFQVSLGVDLPNKLFGQPTTRRSQRGGQND